VEPHQDGRHVGEVLPVADARLGHEHHQQLAKAGDNPFVGVAVVGHPEHGQGHAEEQDHCGAVDPHHVVQRDVDPVGALVARVGTAAGHQRAGQDHGAGRH
jgi:hypothetical protein